MGAELQTELERLKRRSGSASSLRVMWQPKYDQNISGEVKRDVIYVCEKTPEKALETLRHEFLKHLHVLSLGNRLFALDYVPNSRHGTRQCV